jgi:hypothetical protein
MIRSQRAEYLGLVCAPHAPNRQGIALFRIALRCRTGSPVTSLDTASKAS